MRQNFQKAHKIILGYEGGNVDNPKDPGGRTSRGVTQRVYSAYRMKIGKTPQDVYKATDAEVHAIYRQQYWDVCKCDDLPSGIDLIVYNASVNSGPKRAYKLLQASLNRASNAQLAVDGTPGMISVQAASNAPDHDLVVVEFGRKYQAFYQSLSTFKTFGKGWTRRNSNVTKIGAAWAAGSIGPKPVLAAAMSGPGAKPPTETVGYGMGIKATDEDIPEPTVSAGQGNVVTGSGTVAAGGVEAIQSNLMQANQTLEPLSYYMDYVQYACVALIVAGVILTAYATWRQFKIKRVNDSIDSAEILA